VLNMTTREKKMIEVGLEPQIAGRWPKEMRLCNAKMQDRGEEGCWNITIGYVFIQEPDESSPTCTLQESQKKGLSHEIDLKNFDKNLQNLT
jgi:hypothetical protein